VEFKALHEQDKSLKIIDVRNVGEYVTGHIQGSISVPLDTLEKKVVSND
jgi:rhodanese-related sulfurtransferase